MATPLRCMGRDMSVRKMSEVWEHSKSAGSVLLTALAIADFADDNGRCWPSIPTLARKSRVSEDTVRRHVQSLERLGELDVQFRQGRSTMYVIHPATPPQSATPRKVQGVASEADPSHGCAGATPRTAMLPESSVEPSIRTTTTASAGTPTQVPIPKVNPAIEQVRSAFLHTVGKGRTRGLAVAIPALCNNHGADRVLSAIRHNTVGLAGSRNPLRLLEVILEREHAQSEDHVYVKMLDPVAQGVA